LRRVAPDGCDADHALGTAGLVSASFRNGSARSHHMGWLARGPCVSNNGVTRGRRDRSSQTIAQHISVTTSAHRANRTIGAADTFVCTWMRAAWSA